jgi:NifB/MoaA-like Fe-S oxidoreductase
VSEWRQDFKAQLGTNFVFLSDELYLLAGEPMPPTPEFEGFPQIEDGIGLVRQFLDDLATLPRSLPKSVASPRSATLVTGELAGPMVNDLAQALSRVGNLSVNTAVVHNSFFEGNITVTGLLTGADVIKHLNALGDAVGEHVIIPSIMLRDPDRDIFLDDTSIAKFSAKIGRRVSVVERMPSAAARAIL